MQKTGSELIDNFLEGGYEKEVITTIFGPPGAGKTCMCLLASIEAAKDSKVIFIDTEGGFSTERIKQLTNDYERILSNIIVLKPTNFEEQNNAFEKLKDIDLNKIKLIVIDSIAMFYRLEIANTENIINTNKQLGKQLAYLTEIARKNRIPVIITNQVYTNFNEKNISMVGGDLLKYCSKCLIEVQKNTKRKMIIQKHRHIKEGKEQEFKIEEKGIFNS